MKKKLAVLLVLLMAAILLFAACGEDDKPVEEHVHDYGTLIAEVPATCTTAGTEAHYHCSGCNKDFDSNKNEITNLVIPAFGHTPLTDKAVAATCEEDGKTEGKHCAICGEVIVAQQTIPATGHTEVVDEAVAATCTATGKAEGKHCSVCGKVLVAQQIIPATGHTEVIDEGRPATCTENGLTEGKHCSVCGEVIVAQKVIPAGHTLGEWVEGTPATCEADGTKGYFYCSVCEKYFDEDGKTEITDLVIPAPGHGYERIEEAAPTCSNDGVKAHYHCEACGKDFDENKNEVTAADLAIPATGHIWAQLPRVEKVDPISCTVPGMKAHYYCPDCGKYFDVKKKTEVSAEDLILTIAHSFGPLIAEVPATCETAGVAAHYQCSACGKNFDKNKNEISDLTIPALGHTYQQTGELTKKGNSYVIPCHCPTCGKNIDAEYKLTASFRRFLYEDGVCTGISPADDSTLEAHYYCAELDKYMSLDLKEITVADLKPANAIGIYNAADLLALATLVESGNAFAGETFKLCADLDMTGKNFNGLGTSKAPFSGNFDGQGYTVKLDQSYTEADKGGLFQYLLVPNDTLTIQNVKVTGTITVSAAANDNADSHGGLITIAQTGGSDSVLNLVNCWSNVRFEIKKSRVNNIGGFIAFIDHSDSYRYPFTVNIDSCLWDGVINAASALDRTGGFIGYTGQNKDDRPLTVNLKNSISAGTIMLNVGWSGESGIGLLVGIETGNYKKGNTTINVEDVLSIGQITTSTDLSKVNYSQFNKSGDYSVLNLTNFYYLSFVLGNKDKIALVNGGTIEPSSSVNVSAKTVAEFVALTAADFANADQWAFEFEGEYNYPCPAGIYNTFGQPEALKVDPLDLLNEFEISTAQELIDLANNVNNGSTYSGKTIKLTADIDLTDLPWRSIGTRNNGDGAFAFCGTFDGQGHTVTLKSTTGAQSEGGLFGYLGNGAIVKNVKVTGSITLSTDIPVGYYGSVVGCATGTVQISNVLSDVNFLTKAKWFKYSGGFIGGIENLKNADLTITDCVYSGTIFSNASVQESGGFFGYSGRISSSNTKAVTFVRCVFAGTFAVDTTQGYYEDTGLFAGYMQNNNNETGKLTVTMTDCLVAGSFTFSQRASEITKNGACVIGWAGFSHKDTSYTLKNVYYTPNNYSNENPIPAYNSTGGREISGTTAKTLDEMKALTAADFAAGDAWVFVEGEIPTPGAVYNLFAEK